MQSDEESPNHMLGLLYSKRKLKRGMPAGSSTKAPVTEMMRTSRTTRRPLEECTNLSHTAGKALGTLDKADETSARFGWL
jgi:hypothetical protein